MFDWNLEEIERQFALYTPQGIGPTLEYRKLEDEDAAKTRPRLVIVKPPQSLPLAASLSLSLRHTIEKVIQLIYYMVFLFNSHGA